MSKLEDQCPAIGALGSLFKLTEVFLWDDESPGARQWSSFPELTKAGDAVEDDDDDEDKGPNSVFTTSDYDPLPEDVEVASQMNALGLPLSFHTNKKRNGKTKSKRKSICQKKSDSSGEVLESSKVSVGEIVSPTIFSGSISSSLCCISMVDQSEASYCNVAEEDANKNQPCSHKQDNSVSLTGVACDAVKEQNFFRTLDSLCNDGTYVTDAVVDHSHTEVGERLVKDACHEAEDENSCKDNGKELPYVTESAACSMQSNFDGTNDIEHNCVLGDWTVYWDSYYSRNYFYNIKTHTSTWYPPQGMEHLAICDDTHNSNKMFTELTEMDVNPALNLTDLCSLHNKSELFEESVEQFVDNNISVCQQYDELPDRIGLTAGNSVSATTPLPLTQSKSVEDLDELNEINDCHKDGSIECLLLNNLEHISRNKSNQLVPNEAYSSDLPHTFANTSDEQNANYLCGESNKSRSCEETLENCRDVKPCLLDSSSMSLGIGVSSTSMVDSWHDIVTTKRKKESRRTRIQRNLPNDDEELKCQELVQFSAGMVKYWCQRYLLFSRYDNGIKMDEEGWFSVTPESIAKHHALRCGSGLIVDCFTGVGGNAIQFAKRTRHVTAIDIDPKKIDYAHHNAAIYGVDDRIDFIKGDFFAMAPKLKANIVFLSPPWGGPDYAKVETYDIKTMLKPRDGYFLFNTAKEIASRIVMFLPKTVDLNQLAELSLSVSPPWSLEVEKNFLNGKLKSVTAYFNDPAVEE
ncbi:hypothetical protein FNV43_RR11829 [Rhamnella rubrinervis]|uniref:Trimethylguanosine synthase n=1 Tax=Rhamnella rubrinervis TaxID=2594499 RepID=A0A8K0H6Q0_9ROSA|nr:hypothetical protein FNV43_RR11829 [Rhamnella rubrinervis]